MGENVDPRSRTEEQHEAKLLRESVEARVRRLRLAVDRIEDEALRALDQAERGNGRYCTVAEVFVKQMAESAVNAGVEQLTYGAALADEARMRAKVKKELEERA